MLNYNLMIPVEDNQLIKVVLKENKKDTPAERHYKQLCIDEFTWCRKNAEIIINKANCLYNLCMGDSNYKGKTRCLNFGKVSGVSQLRKCAGICKRGGYRCSFFLS